MYPTPLEMGETRSMCADILLHFPDSKALAAAIPPPEAHASSRFLRRMSTALAILVAAATSCAHAQTPSSAVETGNIDTSRVTGAAASDHADANASTPANATITKGTTKTDDKAVGVGQPKSGTPGEPMPWHPLTDF